LEGPFLFWDRLEGKGNPIAEPGLDLAWALFCRAHHRRKERDWHQRVVALS